MNKSLNTQLLHTAGFVFWPDEVTVDWSCDYQQEVNRLIQLVAKDCSEIAEPQTRIKIIERYRLNKTLD